MKAYFNINESSAQKNQSSTMLNHDLVSNRSTRTGVSYNKSSKPPMAIVNPRRPSANALY